MKSPTTPLSVSGSQFLTQGERQELIAAINGLYIDLTNPPPGEPAGPDSFLKILRLMWTDLGLPIEDLGT